MLIGFTGWQVYSTYKKHAQEQTYSAAMSQADFYSKNSRYSSAITLLEKYLESRPSGRHQVDALTMLAFNYSLNKRYDDAFWTFQKVYDLHAAPENVQVMRAIAGYHLQKGDKAAAIKYYKEAITVGKTQPNDPEITPYLKDWEADLARIEASS